MAERIEGIRDVLPTMPYEDRRTLLIGLGVEVTVRRCENPKDGHVVSIAGLLMPVEGIHVPRPAMRWHNQHARWRNQFSDRQEE